MLTLFSDSHHHLHSSPFAAIPDPWKTPVEQAVTHLPHAWMVPIDPNHELAPSPPLEAIMPEGEAEAARLTAGGVTGETGIPLQTGRESITILLADELKLADQADASLRGHICNAVALLEWLA